MAEGERWCLARLNVEIDSLIAFLRFAFVTISIAHLSVCFLFVFGAEKRVNGERKKYQVEERSGK